MAPYSRLANVVAASVAFVATVVGVFVYTSLPRRMGLYSWMAGRDPRLVGMTPAFVLGVGEANAETRSNWNYTFGRLHSNNLKGQSAVVTGASAGIGFAMSHALAGLGAHVTMACRNPAKCRDKANEIRKKLQQSEEKIDGNDIQISTMTIDTSSLKSVKQFAAEYSAAVPKLDMLFLNAGTGHQTNSTHPCIPLSETDNIEYLFQTNYLGHHLLYRLLEPLLLSSEGGDDGRPRVSTVVQTSSAASFDSYTYGVATDLETLNGCVESPMARTGENLAYGQSKLAQILWVRELTKRLGSGSRVVANAFHPGFVDTEIFDKVNLEPKWLVDVVKYFARTAAWTPAEGALTGLFLGVEKALLVKHDVRGRYFHPVAAEVRNELAEDEDLQRKLWDFSDSLIEGYL